MAPRPGAAERYAEGLPNISLGRLLFGNFKDAHFVIGRDEVKMPRWRETKDGIQEFGSLSSLINCLLK